MFEDYFKNQKTTTKEISKNEILQTGGTISSKAYYVKRGLLRSYLIDDNGKIHIFMFAPEGWIIADIVSLTLSGPSELFIDALEDSEIIEIDQRIAFTFTTESSHPRIVEKLFKRIAVLQKRVILLMSAPAKKRYEHFIETYPQLLNRVPQKMIASYLGITPEALSNIKSKIKNQ